MSSGSGVVGRRERSQRFSTKTNTEEGSQVDTEAPTPIHNKNDEGKLFMAKRINRSSKLDSDSTNASLKLLRSWLSHTNSSFHDFSKEEAAMIRRALLNWYQINRRRLPWRGDAPPFDGSTSGISSESREKSPSKKLRLARDYNVNAKQFPKTAYGVWVSEIMLQQTRVEAVIPYWLKWMETFPTVNELANATDEQVNSLWAGLGFYRRARLLHQGAKFVMENYHGCLPKSVAELEKIPGIGRYTASAIASIAFGVCVPVVDGNVCRVLSRLRGIAHHIKAPKFKDKLAWDLAAQIINSSGGNDAGDVNQAMMELGATYCSPSATGVDESDPLKEFYMSTKLGKAYYDYYSTRKQQPVNREPVDFLMDSIVSGSNSYNSSFCGLCHQQGVATVIQQLAEKMEREVFGKNNSLDSARRCGHAVFPIAPPKQSRREEVLSVGAISCVDENGDTSWLLVKRPNQGLLAGQWEFPAACVWSSESSTNEATIKKKRRNFNTGRPLSTTSKGCTSQIPVIASSTRQKALKQLIEDLLDRDAVLKAKVPPMKLQKLKANPLEHIFSHVRHTMWVEHAEMVNLDLSGGRSWHSTSKGREVRWMRYSDMEQTGVTSSVKKVLKAVQQEKTMSQKKQQFFQSRDNLNK